MVFSARVNPEDSYRVLDAGPDPPTERETYRKWSVGPRRLWTGATPQLLSSCYLSSSWSAHYVYFEGMSAARNECLQYVVTLFLVVPFFVVVPVNEIS